MPKNDWPWLHASLLPAPLRLSVPPAQLFLHVPTVPATATPVTQEPIYWLDFALVTFFAVFFGVYNNYGYNCSVESPPPPDPPSASPPPPPPGGVVLLPPPSRLIVPPPASSIPSPPPRGYYAPSSSPSPHSRPPPPSGGGAPAAACTVGAWACGGGLGA